MYLNSFFCRKTCYNIKRFFFFLASHQWLIICERWDIMKYGKNEKIQTLSTVKLKYSADLYKVIDTLNRTLKEDDLMFGLALDDEDHETAVFTIYRT